MGKGVYVCGRRSVGGQWGGEGKMPLFKTFNSLKLAHETLSMSHKVCCRSAI